jgi:2-polyprenyl-6-methoxyphenol hydroxylase-like FAD-dependent oxidoreductase
MYVPRPCREYAASLLDDAALDVVPFAGEGANLAMLDAVERSGLVRGGDIGADWWRTRWLRSRAGGAAAVLFQTRSSVCCGSPQSKVGTRCQAAAPPARRLRF